MLLLNIGLHFHTEIGFVRHINNPFRAFEVFFCGGVRVAGEGTQARCSFPITYTLSQAVTVTVLREELELAWRTCSNCCKHTVKKAAAHAPCAIRCAAFLNPSQTGGPRGSALSNEGGRATEFENVNSKQTKLRMHREKGGKNIHEAADTSSRSPQQAGAGRTWGGGLGSTKHAIKKTRRDGRCVKQDDK